ncbi:MAG: hypothetical protein AB7K37_11575 [Cyclobacteriaceae bacterium]
MTFALIYTIGGPVVNTLISAFNTRISKWSENWNIRISEGAKIPIEKYLTLRKNYQEQSSTLEKAIATETATQSQLINTQSSLRDEQQRNNQLSGEVSNARRVIDNLYRLDNINGMWIKTTHKPTDTNPTVENIQVMSGKIVIHEPTGTKEAFRIESFMYDVGSNKIVFALFSINPATSHSGFFSFSDLRFEHNTLVGHEYYAGNKWAVRYVRPDPELRASNKDSSEEQD